MSAKVTLGCTDSPNVAAILSWPAEAVLPIRRAVLARSDRSSSSADDLSCLVAHGLADERGRWTSLGEVVSDLLIHESWQEGDEVQQTVADQGGRAGAAVLDVGCSSGWTLRQFQDAERRVGVDIDDEALALGFRLARAEEQAIEFRSASAAELPFEDGSFDLVICRNALTYTPQRQSLCEMTRVLRPGGSLLLRFENYRYDLQGILRVQSPKALCCRMRDLVIGMAHTVSGWQIAPGQRRGPGRVFGSRLRIQKVLRSQGCELLTAASSLKCPRFLGRPNQTFLHARRCEVRQPAASSRGMAFSAVCLQMAECLM